MMGAPLVHEIRRSDGSKNCLERQQQLLLPFFQNNGEAFMPKYTKTYQLSASKILKIMNNKMNPFKLKVFNLHIP